METKKIKITMQVSYEVSMECEVNSDILKSLQFSQDSYPNGINCGIADWDDEVTPAFNWITENCSENKCSDWNVEIQEIDEEV